MGKPERRLIFLPYVWKAAPPGISLMLSRMHSSFEVICRANRLLSCGLDSFEVISRVERLMLLRPHAPYEEICSAKRGSCCCAHMLPMRRSAVPRGAHAVLCAHAPYEEICSAKRLMLLCAHAYEEEVNNAKGLMPQRAQ
ncbi:hypothetical protein DUNSADRAFT_2663 [Dunaliella salina]|uniref:Encoded protein n=1 Tax=Dunaliella salina TaxID=3046 RepID=A0ABQ7H871_DUNSA|nr:hypothetical protein DUNSADRAFT_2663 [Dunaliella salina]|eukprot:KAF5843050.1 hypothetical protein DUNSADRAFT_2663 [Dunaliella salina]